MAELNFAIEPQSNTLNMSVTPGTPVDPTLSIAGLAADAKATGDALDSKVNKVTGKQLSTNDYTDAEKTKMSGIEAGANKTIVDEELDDESENPVQNKVIKGKIDEIEEDVSGLEDDISTLNQAIDDYVQALNGIGLDIENGTLVIEPVTA